MEMLKEHLDNRGEQTLFLNLDIEWDRPHFESQADVTDTICLILRIPASKNLLSLSKAGS